eukprot:gene16189-22351_t
MPPGNGDHDLTGKPHAGERKGMLLMLPLLLLIGTQAAVSDKCSLQRNVIQTRAQLRDCDFKTVLVLPHVHELRQALMGGDAIQSARVPFPVIECTIIPGVSFNKSLFFEIMSDSANHLDTMPPCVRPALGREAVAYTSFMALNHDIMPPFIIFLHGHVTSWHQDRPMYEILNEASVLLPSVTNSASIYLSLNSKIQRDLEHCLWHRLTGSKKRRDLEHMYVKYFEKYLGPLPEDLAHFCCAQFLNFAAENGAASVPGQVFSWKSCGHTFWVHSRPSNVPGAISAGGSYATCVLFTNGRVKCWGRYRDTGILPYTLDYVDLGITRTATTIATGPHSTCATLENGDCICSAYGYNFEDYTTVDPGTGRTATAVAIGESHSCVLQDNGAVKCWGYDGFGQLGFYDRDKHSFALDDLSGSPAVDLGTGRTATAIAVGNTHSCAILDNGAVVCWGLNNDGQMGQQADSFGDIVPVNLGTGRTATAIAAGESHTCALLKDGDVKCWGKNRDGQLGLGNNVSTGGFGATIVMGDDLPAVDLGTDRKVVAITAGAAHTCALLDKGEVKCWGSNDAGQLGLGGIVSRGDDVNEMGDTLPVVDLGTGRTATAINTGDYHTCALLDDSSMKCWGKNDGGQLGNGKYCDRGGKVDQMGDNLPAIQFNPPLPKPPSPPQPPKPPGVDLSRDVPRAVMVGVTHTCVLFTNGRVKCWGYLDFLGLGIKIRGEHRETDSLEMTRTLRSISDYVDLGTGRTSTTIAVGVSHTCAILDKGDLKCWGHNDDFQLGVKKADRYIGYWAFEMGDELPAVDLGTGRTATAIVVGGKHTCALLDNAVLKCWGANTLGQLGHGNVGGCAEMGDDLPPVDLGTGHSATAIAAGKYHTCAILDNADLKCWGHNNWGQLGLSDKETRASCWGFNLAGELGVGDNATHATVGDGLLAVDLGTGRTATAIAAGGHHTCALLDNGKLKCWGFNELGQLGLGDTKSRGDNVGEMGDNLPEVDLGTNRTAITITANGQHSCAILDDNSVKCWGRNKFGQLGLSDTMSRGGGVAEMGDNLPALQFNPTQPTPLFSSPDAPQSALLPPSLQIPLAPSLSSSTLPSTSQQIPLAPFSSPSLPSPPPRPPLPPFPPKPPAQPYGSGPMPTITTTSRELNEKFDSIPSEVTLTVSDEACKAIDAVTTPFILAFQEQFASDWNTSNPNTPIKNGDVKVTFVNPVCGSRRSHRSLLQPSSTVITTSSINLPTGVTASASMIGDLKEASSLGMLVGSFASNFGVKGVTVTPSTPVTLIASAPPRSPPSASDPGREENDGSSDNLAITLAAVAVGISGTVLIIVAVLAIMLLSSKKKAGMVHPQIQA